MHWPSMLCNILALALAAPPAAPAAPTVDAKASEYRFSIYAGPRGAVRFGNGATGAGGSYALGAGYRLIRGLWLVGELAEGYYTNPGEVLGQIRAGFRYEAWTRPVRPLIFIGFDHNHQQLWADFKDEPLLSLIGASDEIEHRSGVAAGAGLRIPFSWDPQDVAHHFSVLARVDLAYYIDKKPSPVVLGLGLLLSVSF